MMTMMANEGNDGIEDIDVFNTCHISLPYPDASAYWQKYLDDFWQKFLENFWNIFGNFLKNI